MSFVKDLFGGGGGGKTTTVSQPGSVPITYSPQTGFFSNIAGGRQISAGPTNVQISGDQGTSDAYGRFLSGNAASKNRLGSMITNLQSNQNPFIQARVKPLEQAFNERRGILQRGLTQRGVTGSLANNELLKFDRESQSTIADQRALATNESLNALLGAETANMNLNDNELEFVRTRLSEELGLLGLNMTALNLIRGDVRPLTQVAGGTQTVRDGGSSDFGSTLAGIGSIIGAMNGVPVG